MGDGTVINPDSKLTYNATNIVMSLDEDALDEGGCIYVDNWYSSVELLSETFYRCYWNCLEIL